MSERLPNLYPLSQRKRKSPSAEVIQAYRDNKRRLLMELSKEVKDRWTRNNIQAYQHIIRWLEEEYEL